MEYIMDSVFISRRKTLVQLVKQAYPQASGSIVLFADFELGTGRFQQESSFYYLTGLHEPGAALVLSLDGTADLYLPNCMKERKKWMVSPDILMPEVSVKAGIANVHELGSVCKGYTFHPFFPRQEYENLLTRLEKIIAQGGSLFTLCPDTPHQYVQQRLLLQRLAQFLPALSAAGACIDISALIASMRRVKDQHELEAIFKAVELTALAQEAAAQAIGDGVTEAEVQAGLEYMFTGSHARPAFASIVASGKNSVILHYVENNDTLQKGDLVVVDIGAQLHHYCADITRTYPVSGTFTERQREIYDLVLSTQAYIATIAKPGYWLNNADQADRSLNHLAHAYIRERGYGDYFTHSIGHFLGLDVHDVGDYKEPLKAGDVITIEPGIYIPHESLGIRIEDNYLLIDDGTICLSEGIVKNPDDIERMMKTIARQSDACNDDESCDDECETDEDDPDFIDFNKAFDEDEDGYDD
jgi:Xaa-Pro aminopeptidase